MDDILPRALHLEGIREPTGCSSIIMNGKNERIIAHTEDALTEALNHYYFVVAHITSDVPQGKHKVKEERFMSLCYAGHLPGYTMSYNHHGLIFTVNTISAANLRSGKTPRHFICRALLGAKNYEEAIKVLKDEGTGAGDGCSINLSLAETNMCYNIEMGPTLANTLQSCLDIKEVPVGTYNCHTNKYERLQLPEVNELMQASSIARMGVFGGYSPPKSGKDVLNMLGDCSGGEHCVFRDDGDMNQAVKTIAVGCFDLNNKTLALFSDNPRYTQPHVTLPLILKDTESNEIKQK